MKKRMLYNDSVEDMMRKPRNGECGATAIEYIVLLALILLAALAAISLIGYRKDPTLKDDPVRSIPQTVGAPQDSGVDPSAPPALSPDVRATPDIPQGTLKRSTDAPPAFGTSTPTLAPAASRRTPAPAAPSSPEPVGVEPPHRGPPDSG